MKAAPLALLLALIVAPFAAAADRPVMVIAHRGEHLHHAENTLPAFQAAIDAGADFFECDVRATSDGRLVLMHDGSVDRTTNGKGRVSDHSLEQIRTLRAGDAMIPTLEEALLLARGRIGGYVDYKDAPSDSLVAAIEGARMGEHCVIYGDRARLTQVLARRPDWKVMPEAKSPAVLKELIGALHLGVAAFDQSDFKPATIEVAKKAGIEIYVDCLGPSDNPAGWSAVLRQGATGIQTDLPFELVRFLRSKGLHN